MTWLLQRMALQYFPFNKHNMADAKHPCNP
jgi:hypothetical protein